MSSTKLACALTVLIGLSWGLPGCQRDSPDALTFNKEQLAMHTDANRAQDLVEVRSPNGQAHLCFQLPPNLTWSMTADGTSLTIEFNDIKDLNPQDASRERAITGMGRYRLVITAYNDAESRDAALQRISSGDTPVNIGDYGVALGRLSDPYSPGSILAVSRGNLLGMTFYIIFDQGQQRAVREHETAVALSFVDSSLVPCQRK